MTGVPFEIYMTSHTQQLRVAVIGCGRMGLQTAPSVRRVLPDCWLPLSHSDAVDLHPGLKLVGLCDPLSSARDRAKALYPHLPIYAEPEQLLGEQFPDLVCIATRTPGRSSLIQLCLNYGVRHLHIEKPLCTSVAELLVLETLLLNYKVHCTFGTLRRYLTPYTQALSLLANGKIGALHEVHVAFGLGRLCWTQVHAIDLISLSLQPHDIVEVRSVADELSYESNGYVLDGDPFVSFARFSTDYSSQGIISTSSGCDLFLYGESGHIGVLNDGQQFFIRQASSDSKSYLTSTQYNNVELPIYGGTAAALNRHCIMGVDDGVCDTIALLHTQRLLFSCVQSILSKGAPVHPNELESQIQITGRSGSLFA